MTAGGPRRIVSLLSHRGLRLALGLAVAIGVAVAVPARAVSPPGVFVMGVDGMDPEITARLIAEGKMPNFKRLAREGSFQPLGTSNPPQSPVAWSNFVTGMDPGGHGIFDFMHRDLETYAPVSSATAVGEEASALNILGYVIPLGGEMLNNRGGTPWWAVTIC